MFAGYECGADAAGVLAGQDCAVLLQDAHVKIALKALFKV